MSTKFSIQKSKWKKRLLAVALTMAMIIGLCSTGLTSKVEVVKGATTTFSEDFEGDSYVGWVMGTPTLAITADEAHGGTKSLFVSGREQDYFSYSYDFTQYAGKTISLKAFMKVDSDDLLAAACLKHTVDNEETPEDKEDKKDKYDWIANNTTKSDEWIELAVANYKVPEGAKELYFVTAGENGAGTKDDFYLDDVTIEVLEDAQSPEPDVEMSTKNVVFVQEDFNDYVDTTSIKGIPFGSPTFGLSESGVDSSKALQVSGRDANYYCYAYDVSAIAGKKIDLSAKMATYEVEGAAENIVSATLKTTKTGKDDAYMGLASAIAVGTEFVTLTGTYEIPADVDTAVIYFEVAEEINYLLDDVLITYQVPVQVKTIIKEDFNDYTDANSKKGIAFGNPTFSLSESGVESSKALQVSDRTENYFSYAYDVAAAIGNKVNLSAKMATYEVEDAVENEVKATLKMTKTGADDVYETLGSAIAVGKEFVSLTGSYEIPADVETAVIYFETAKDISYLLDDVTITAEGDFTSENEGPTYADVSGYQVLKDLYKDDFIMGVACEAISHWNNNLSEIGNPAKEDLIKRQFNSITFGNELKPDYNMGYKSEDATETFLPYVVNPAAKEMLDWAKDNGIPVRGHTLVWHSQCPDAIFCKEYKPVYLDADNKQLDPSCYVSRDVMLQRLESYIYDTMDYMYKNGYGKVIYAWDVVNEAVEPGWNEYNLRDSHWYRTIGEDFVYYAFKYTRESVNQFSKRYATLYGIDENDEAALKAIQPTLFYNDYNEFQAVKRDAIISLLTKEINGHSIKGEGLIDGVGMQAHVTDTTNVDTFIEALNMYSEAIGEVHITELDVAQTSTGVNAEYYQAVFYKNLFKALIDAVDKGANLTSVTIWGLTDDNSWKKETYPLFFNADLSKKLAFDAVVYAQTGEELPAPAYEAPDFKDMNCDFETAEDTEGFSVRGGGSVTVQNDVVYMGEGALLCSGREANWHGAQFEVSRFSGQTIAISARVKSNDPIVKLSANIEGLWPNIAEVDTSSGEWVEITGTYKIPLDVKGLSLYFETSDVGDIYIDHLKVKLVGLEESFEESTNIASARGVGHMPVVTVTDSASHNEGGKSFLVQRQAQDANMSFDVSKYIGQKVHVTAYVKTTDSKISLGFAGDSPILITQVNSVSDDWTKVEGEYSISNSLISASMYIETDGTADFYVDDIFVEIADYVDDVEGETLNFTTRWGGAGTISRVEDGENNHAVKLSDKDQPYYGIVFDASAYLGMEVEISFDAKTDDEHISLSGDITDLWPNYVKVTSTPGSYKRVSTIVKLPSDLSALRIYVESDGLSDLYVDNLRIRRVRIDEEVEVTPTPNPVPNPVPTTPTQNPTPTPTPVVKDEEKVELNVSSTGTITVEELVELKGKEVVASVTDEAGNVACEWSFVVPSVNPASIKDLKLGISKEDLNDSKYKNGLLLTTEHQGKLPMPAKLSVNVASNFKANDTLYLYIYDSKTGKLNCVPNSKYIVDENGTVKLDIISGTNYVLLPKIPKNRVWLSKQIIVPKTSSIRVGSTRLMQLELPDALTKVSSLEQFDKEKNKALLGVVITYQSSDSSIAEVSNDGNITALSKGTATITATIEFSNGYTKKIVTTVTTK